MSQPMNPYDSPEPVRTGMSSTAKVLLVLGIGFGLVCLLCCGGIGGGLFWTYRLVKDSVSEEPGTIRKVTSEIANLEIPAGFEPKMSFDMAVPFTGQKSLKWVAYANAAQDGSLMLAQFDQGIADETSMREQLRVSTKSSGRGDAEEIDVKESEKVETEVNGEPAYYTVAKGIGRKSSQEYWQVTGTFKGKAGPAILILATKTAELTKDDVMKVIHSIK